ncbi:MAG: hypothetical protein WCG44_01700 [bacterium]
MAKKPQKINNNDWNKDIDFALVALTVILFGSAVAYVMIQAVR